MTYPHTKVSTNLYGITVHQFGRYSEARAEVLLMLHNGKHLRVHCPSESAAQELLTDCVAARRNRTLTMAYFDGTVLHGDDIHRLEGSVV